MKHRRTVQTKPLPSVERNPEPAEGLDKSNWGLPLRNVSRHAEDGEISDDAEIVFAVRRSLPPKPTIVDAPVKVFSYVGTASNSIGSDGDFYVEETTNTLYGPKTDGAWPEDGVKVDGPIACKRTFWSLGAGNVKGVPCRRLPRGSSSGNSLVRGVKSFLRTLYSLGSWRSSSTT